MADGKVSLTEGDVGRHLVQLSMPMFLGSASMILASMIDTVYVGWIGAKELAAVSFAFPLMIAMVTIATGLGIGAASISARAMGAGDMRRVSRVSTDALLLCTVLVIACTILAYVFMEPLVGLLGAKGEVLPLTVDYMKVWVWGLPLFSIPMVGTGMMRAVGNARAPAVLLSAGAGLQVIIAPALIFGIPGINEGICLQGVAWAICASR
jgi:Na+-driven multidrug efflux pump